jgi:lipoyl(octanoyl) transferase
MGSTLTVMDLGCQAYADVLSRQEQMAHARQAGQTGDTLILVEHEPVYTLGRNARSEHILLSPEQLERAGIGVYRTGRGGDVTYHGPGQLVGYPILHLGERKCTVVDYVGMLEVTLLRTLMDFGIQARVDARNRGVWVGDDKVAAIGVRVARHVSLHGFSLNVNTNLAPYQGIVPCGLHHKGVTSLKELGMVCDMAEVKRHVVGQFAAVFGFGEVIQRGLGVHG